nr:MAG TPA: hypothetical protein [Caudoviricetes sp.]
MVVFIRPQALLLKFSLKGDNFFQCIKPLKHLEPCEKYHSLIEFLGQ